MDFNVQFRLNWIDRLNRRFLIFLGISSLIILSQIIIVANLDYSEFQEQNKTRIFDEYKRLVTELITEIELQKVVEDTSFSGISVSEADYNLTSRVSPAERQNRRIRTDSLMARRGILNPEFNSDQYADLPIFGDDDSDLLSDEFVVVELSRKGNFSGMRFQTRRRNINHYEINEFDEPLNNLYNYVIRRQGTAYINPTNELLNDNQLIFGYRDPDEIQRVISKYKPMIEHCYRKALTLNGGTSGYVKVQFQISYAGFVIPESIQVLNSTIKNRHAVQCIKKYIKRWRNFAALDETMGIARVTQKFVFN